MVKRFCFLVVAVVVLTITNSSFGREVAVFRSFSVPGNCGGFSQQGQFTPNAAYFAPQQVFVPLQRFYVPSVQQQIIIENDRRFGRPSERVEFRFR